MCQWASALVTKTGEVLHNFWTDSHEDLISLFSMRDDGKARFIRIEFSPDDPKNTHLPEKYKLRVDETDVPAWFDEEMRSAVVEKMTVLIRRCIKSGAIKILIGDVFILAPSAKVEVVKDARVVTMLGSSKVGTMMGSSKVGTMWESSKVGAMLGSPNVGTMWESSEVGTMHESSKVGTMRESSKVVAMWESSNVGTMWESSEVGTMLGSSNVGTMRESSEVGTMLGSSNVGTMRESSKVGAMRESSNVIRDKRLIKAK